MKSTLVLHGKMVSPARRLSGGACLLALAAALAFAGGCSGGNSGGGGTAVDAAPPYEFGPPKGVGVLAIGFSGTLPGPTSPKIPATLKVYEQPLKNPDHARTYAELATSPVALESAILLGGHGNSSWGAYPMKSMEFDSVDEAGLERDIALFGMPEHSDWQLYACYADVTCLHNWFTYELGREMGAWAPRTHFVEVFVNGAYGGLYLLEEAVKRGKRRVAIDKPADDQAAGDVSGGYILKFNSSKYPGDQFKSAAGTAWNFHYPRFDKITPAQKAYVQGYVNRLEASFSSASWTDPERGYKQHIDLPSWVDHVIVQELANNPDAYWRSQYLFKHSDADGGKLHLGPLWDFDLSWGISSLRDSFNYDFFSYVKGPAPGGAPGPYPGFLLKVWKDPAFQRAVRCRWQELRMYVLDVAKIHAQIDAAAAVIAMAEARHHRRWPILGQSGIPAVRGNSARPTYQANVDYMKTWIENRIGWMDANLPGTCE